MARVVWDSPWHSRTERSATKVVTRCCAVALASTRARSLKAGIRRAACVHSHRSGILKSISDDQKNQPTFDQPTTWLPCPRCSGSLLLPPRGARASYRRPTFERRFLRPKPKHATSCISLLRNGYSPPSFLRETTNREHGGTRIPDLFQLSRPCFFSYGLAYAAFELDWTQGVAGILAPTR